MYGRLARYFIFLSESLESMTYATCLIMFILSQTAILFLFDLPVNMWVASFMFMLSQGQRFFNQLYIIRLLL